MLIFSPYGKKKKKGTGRVTRLLSETRSVVCRHFVPTFGFSTVWKASGKVHKHPKVKGEGYCGAAYVMDKIIKSITLELDGQEITVTEEQARTLHAALADLLGEPKEKVHYVPYAYPSWTTPSWQLPYTTTSTGTGCGRTLIRFEHR